MPSPILATPPTIKNVTNVNPETAGLHTASNPDAPAERVAAITIDGNEYYGTEATAAALTNAPAGSVTTNESTSPRPRDRFYSLIWDIIQNIKRQ